MDGQLSEQPLAELIREISSKSLGGRLRLEHERVKIVAYFDAGSFVYAASNVRTLRFREYLLKGNVVTEQALKQFNDRVADGDVIKVLCAQKLLTPSAAEQAQARQVSDVLRLALLWTEGTWEFDSRSRLTEQLNFKIDAGSLLLEAARRLPAKFALSRFHNPVEVISPLGTPLLNDNLLPAEVFLLSRLDRPTPLRDLIAVSGMGEEETCRIVYALAVAGLVQREHWRSAFGARQPTPPPPEPEKETTPSRDQSEVDLEEVENFLARVKKAQTHYDVLDVNWDATAQNLKTVYYQLARRYHPDRFRKTQPAVVARLESAFARITQAYDTLRDDTLRANYNSKLEARQKAAARLDDSAPKVAAQAVTEERAVGEPAISKADRAAEQFKEGLAALELGERKTALGLFASAARAVPNEPRYRANYGRLLAADERTRRAAEAELSTAVKLDPGNAEYRVMLAELYRDLGLKLRAKGEAERAVAANPNHQKARELLRELK